ncbi:MAG: winged helix-turn-helix transcriptional regulator [Desulfarculaceae bacterium]|nr:winged helix-turn-helix transcriptional regulator [Desulfarculaceae bacterium]
MKNQFDNQVRLQLLNLLKNNPNLTQRGMNRQMGVSLGKINYCLNTLSEKGMVKVEYTPTLPVFMKFKRNRIG